MLSVLWKQEETRPCIQVIKTLLWKKRLLGSYLCCQISLLLPPMPPQLLLLQPLLLPALPEPLVLDWVPSCHPHSPVLCRRFATWCLLLLSPGSLLSSGSAAGGCTCA
ncbi:hypothetical protein Y1Q_0006139 [Alligator mississippiensis]|uniref:Uncharacterized protein n=1 Tax=Alligator mississippiensis TaxID=8496 RepID=A0A151NWY3_ALLMI|nr:hypothetical protein Y1Q_0006139 [Alligator mississippiensis]